MVRLAFSLIAFLASASLAQAEIKFLKPGAPPLSENAASETDGLDLDTIYRGLDLLSLLHVRASKGMVVTAVVGNYKRDDIDGQPGITLRDRDLMAEVEIARKRARGLAASDLNGDGAVTLAEKLILDRLNPDRSRLRPRIEDPVEVTETERQQLVQAYFATFPEGDSRAVVSGVDADRIRTRIRTEGRYLKPIWDVNGDGKITEPEIRREMDRLLDLFDVTGDNVIDLEESKAARRVLLDAKFRAGDPSRGKFIKCSLPAIPSAAEVAVVQGERGTAVTNLAFAVPNDPVVRLAEVSVPEGAQKVHLIASMRTPTVLRLVGPGADRVTAVIGVAAPVALDGRGARVLNTPCHIGFLGTATKDSGGVAEEFGQALGRSNLRAVVGDRLGRVDLATLTNDENAVLMNTILPRMQGDGQVILDRFLAFDPGGYQQLKPRRITANVRVTARDLPPLEIGLIVLASEGKIDFVAPPPGFAEREVPKDVKRETVVEDTPGGVVWRRTADGGQRAVFPLTVVVREAIDLPAGLTTERGVRLIVPDGVPKPVGAKNYPLYMGE